MTPPPSPGPEETCTHPGCAAWGSVRRVIAASRPPYSYGPLFCVYHSRLGLAQPNEAAPQGAPVPQSPPSAVPADSGGAGGRAAQGSFL